jgi:hypothetical protein
MAKRNEEPQVDAPAASDTAEGLSSQPQFSTYKEDPDKVETNPPAGRQVVQELGKASK